MTSTCTRATTARSSCSTSWDRELWRRIGAARREDAVRQGAIGPTPALWPPVTTVRSLRHRHFSRREAMGSGMILCGREA